MPQKSRNDLFQGKTKKRVWTVSNATEKSCQIKLKGKPLESKPGNIQKKHFSWVFIHSNFIQETFLKVYHGLPKHCARILVTQLWLEFYTYCINIIYGIAGETDNRPINTTSNIIIMKEKKQYVGVENNGEIPLNSMLKEDLSGLVSSIRWRSQVKEWVCCKEIEAESMTAISRSWQGKKVKRQNSSSEWLRDFYFTLEKIWVEGNGGRKTDDIRERVEIDGV